LATPLDTVVSKISRGMKQKNPSNLYLRNEHWWMHIQRGGKRHHFSLHTKELAEAVRKREAYLADPQFLYGFRQQNLEREVQKYIEGKSSGNCWSRESAVEKSRVLTVFADAIGADRALHTIKPAEIESYLENKKANGCKGGTVNGYLMTIQAFFNECVASRLLVQSPLANIKPFRDEHPVREKWCTKEQVLDLYSNAPTPDLKFILGCGFMLGIRKKEITESRSEWFNLESRFATLKMVREDLAARTGLDTFIPKTRKERSIPIPEPFAVFLSEYLTDRDYCLAPDVRRGKYRYRYDFRRPFEEYVTKKGLGWVSPHTMRHTFATHLARKATPITQLAGYLGDSVKTTLKHYAHHYPDHQDVAGIYGIQ
jgi:integrase